MANLKAIGWIRMVGTEWLEVRWILQKVDIDIPLEPSYLCCETTLKAHLTQHVYRGDNYSYL